ncbi:MAG: type II secretion system F family protein [Thermoguttaceae bacterium]|jgi:type IV pilus assembly protein PilC
MDFQYRVRDPLGNVHEGSIEAASAEAATQQLRRDGFHVLEVGEAESDSLFPPRVSKNDIIYVTTQLAIMVDTGISLSTALGGLLEQETNGSLRKILADLKSSVEAGDDFSSALTRYPKHFDKTYISLIKASEATGSLGAMLDRIARYLRKEVEMRHRVRAALAYPAVMMVIATGVTIFLLTYILPKFTPLFKARGTKLPTPTLVMMRLSDALLTWWYLWLAGAALVVAGLLYARRTPAGRRTIDWLKIYTPIVGPMMRKVVISRSIRTLGTMLGNGVAIMDSIKLAGQVAANSYYEDLWQRVLDEVATGKRICEVLRGNPLFPRVLVQMIASGEETGKLDVVLEKVSTYYDQEVETSVKAATAMIEPIMISVMGAVIGTIGLALMLPIFSLSKQP